MTKTNWKKWIPDLVILLIFALAAAIYFYPALQGKVIYAGDNISGRAAVQESSAWKASHAEGTWWTGSMFAGMPNYQIGGNGGYAVDRILRPVRMFFSWGTRNAFAIFLFYLVAFFLLLRAFKVDKWASMAGAFAIALSSYFFVIIAASHHGKCYSITWMTLAVVGFLLTYRKQYGWGAVITAFFTYIGFFLHPQMSYYICMMIGVFFFAELAIAVQNKEWKHFGIATVVFFASFAIGMGMGSANIFVNQEYAKETMRGGHSDLVKATDSANKTDGLDLDYATAWSEGIDESLTFLVPNYMGGASGYNLGKDSQLEKDLRHLGVPGSQARNFCQGAPTYWGEKAFTSGPVYMGAIICFLFILGLILVDNKNPYKWALLAATLFSLFLSWGRHFMGLTELFYNWFPMYNKFRAVESILIVAEITVPLLGMLAVKEIADGKHSWKFTRNSIFIAGGITGAICLFIALFGGGFDVTSSYDDQWKSQVGDQIYDMILNQRHAMMTADAWRSLLFVLLGAVAVFGYAYLLYKKPQAKHVNLYFGFVLTALIVADIWPVDKRFCNDSNFVSVRDRDRAFKILPYEQQLLDSDPSYYRVLNLTVNTFNDARTSYYLKSIGGYSAAKLRRYQDLIDEHISKMNWNVINMLNTKYIITQDQQGNPYPYYNMDAFGNCWFVDSLQAVSTANEESDALRTLNLRRVAVYDEKYAANQHILQGVAAATPADSSNRIDCLGYEPNRLRYTAQCATPKTAVLSEIYYPYGWKATIDGQPTELFRVDYMLRALTVPAGKHEIELVFDPDSVKKGNMLSLACFAVFMVLLLGMCGWTGYKCVKNKKAKA